jgi:integrase
MASVRKRQWVHKGQKRAAFVVRYTDHGGTRRLKTFETEKAAKAYRMRIEVEIEGGVHTADAETVTLRSAVEAWLTDCERRHQIGAHMTGDTIRGYRNYAERHVIPALGGALLTKLTADRMQDFINAKAATMARSSCKAMRLVLMQSLRFAVKRKWLRRNPLADEPLEVPPEARVRRVTIPSREEIGRILATLAKRRPYEQPRARANRILIVTLALFCGMRRGEIVGLQWENVDLEDGVIHIRHSFSRSDGLKSPKTPAGNRTITMAPPVRMALEGYAATYGNGSGFVLQSRNGTPLFLDHVTGYDWQVLLRDAGVIGPNGRAKYSLHSLRHANVSLLIEQGLAAFHIKEHIGHSRIATTMDVYGHILPENDHTRRAITAIGAGFQATAALAPPAPSKAPITAEEWAAAKAAAHAMHEDKITPVDIARRLNVSMASVYNWLKQAKPSAVALAARQGATTVELST